MDLTLVPFGYETSQNQLVDVQSVPSGKKCGCICPSCRAPLVARKGNKNVWHFAHDSKGELQNKPEKCKFSFYVSARIMARQLIIDRPSITLPDFKIELSAKNPFTGSNISVVEVVTKARTVILEDVSFDTRVAENQIDLSGHINGYNLAFVFTHPGRNDYSHLAFLEEQKTGVVAIPLKGLREQFHGNKASNRSYGEILSGFISKDEWHLLKQ